MERCEGTIRPATLPSLCFFLLAIAASWPRAASALDEYVAPLRTPWQYIAWAPGLQCHADETSALAAQYAGTGGFCRWTNGWPNTSNFNGAWQCPGSPSIPMVGHWELRFLTYQLDVGEACGGSDEINSQLTRQFWYYCEDSENYDLLVNNTDNTAVCQLKAGKISPRKQSDKSPECGNPVRIATGHKCQHEQDDPGLGRRALQFERHYYAGKWSNTYARSIELIPVSASLTQIWVNRADGLGVPFHLNSGVVQKDSDVSAKLVQLFSSGSPNGWRFTDANDNVEVYDVNGRLTSITTRSGETQSLAYDASSRLSTVTDPYGHQLTLGYDSNGRLATLTRPDTQVVQYAYDSSGRLSTATFPDTRVRTYVYNETANTSGANLPNALTGIIDENSARYATYQYDIMERAIATEHAGGAARLAVTYNTDGSRTLTDAAGAARTLSITIQNRIGLPGAVTGSPCPSCGFASSTSYDANNNVTSETDFRGNKTCYAYDVSRNLQTVRLEGVASGVSCPANLASYTPTAGTRQRKISTQWHSTFRLPTQVDEPAKRTTFTYDSMGNMLTKIVLDTTTSQSRTWTYTYNSFGQILTADGPRTDVTDVTTYTYYSCTAGYQCGQLHTITNAAGHITTYDTYNAHGQPLTITDPNAVVTTLTYDARQRLTSRSVDAEQTTLAYWPTGLLKKVTLPDSSFLEYTYDAAHRLTEIEDSEGNRLVYTLDAMGNRTAENLRDSSNALTQTARASSTHSISCGRRSELQALLQSPPRSATTTMATRPASTRRCRAIQLKATTS